MRKKLNLLACLVALTAVLPARATLIFELYRPNNQTNITVFNTSTTGLPATGVAAFNANYSPITTPIVMTPLSELIVTAVLRQTDTVGADTFADIGGILDSQRMIGYGFAFRYLPGIVDHKAPINTYASPLTDTTAGLNLEGFSGQPNVFTNVAGVSTPRDLTLSTGYFTPSDYYVLASFRLVAPAEGSGNLQIFDAGSGDDIGSAATTGMDPLIFGHAPGGIYNFPIVVAVPEPTSMTLVGLAFAGIAVRARRKTRV